MHFLLPLFVVVLIVNEGSSQGINVGQVVSFQCIDTHRRDFRRVVVEDANLRSKLNLSLPLSFVVHGWRDSADSRFVQIDGVGWPLATCQQWVKFVDSNCCAVDWHALSQQFYFLVAPLFTRVVGRYLADFIRPAVAQGISANDISIAGHSAGSHIAGFAGERLLNNNIYIKAIYGLDPAGPFFSTPINLPYNLMLNPNDAQFVQTLHTSGYTYGTTVSMGHQDFIANNGVVQPGCLTTLINPIVEPTFGLVVACSHLRAVQVFYYSLDPKYEFIGTRCTFSGILGLLNNVTDTCESRITDRYGIYAQKIAGDYQLPTTSLPPYCIGCPSQITFN